MTIDAEAYKHAMQPHTPTPLVVAVPLVAIAAALDKSDKHSKAAHKAQERKRQQRAEQQAENEKQA